MGSDGYCLLSAVLAARPLAELKCIPAEILHIVETNDKQRFTLMEHLGRQYIRCVQGHSVSEVSDDELLQRLDLTDSDFPTLCVHGSYWRHYKKILREGLRPGGDELRRRHIHFAIGDYGDASVVSGMRADCKVTFYINIVAAVREGVPFYRSLNGVILVSG